MLKLSIALVAAISLLAGGCACSRKSTVVTRDGSVSVEQGKNGEASLHAVGKDGSSVDVNTGKSITDYPADVPLYAGKSAMDMKSSEKRSRVVLVQSPDSVDTISKFYKSGLESKGWKVDSATTTDQFVMYTASKDNRNLVVEIGKSGNTSSISQSLAEK